MEFIITFFNELLVEAILCIVIAGMGISFRKYVKSQNQRNKKQHERNQKWRESFERKLSVGDTESHIEIQQIIECERIRALVQKARDNARKVENIILIEDHELWKIKLSDNSFEIRGILHDRTILIILEHFGLYSYLEAFQRVFDHLEPFNKDFEKFCIAAKSIDLNDKDKRFILVEHLDRLCIGYDGLVAQIQLLMASLSLANRDL